MLSVNNMLFDPKNIYNFIDASINKLLHNMPELRMEKEYWLFYYIKDDFFANWRSLQNVDINQDFLGFPLIKKNTRHAIEAFLDLNNLCHDKDYLIVLEYGSKLCQTPGKYQEYLYKGQFTIQSKNNIAKAYGQDFQTYIEKASDSNRYVHPNVFLDIIQPNEIDKKRNILCDLLNTNTYLLTEAYKLILNKYNNNQHPYLGCSNCVYNQCDQCYQNAYNTFKYCINYDLLKEFPNIFGGY